ncbi:MAG: methyltransferase domain-containing protein [Nitrososphaerota archaeon]|nr:methyltransferase domain-containing protein [Nitrososphaerota archaeon]
MQAIAACRICGNTHLDDVLDLGEQALTGVFPGSLNESVATAPLQLVKCSGRNGDGCGLLQLNHSCSPEAMFQGDYGYRSDLNATMVGHLRSKALKLAKIADLAAGDLIVDIGSNDGTLLKSYPKDKKLKLVGVDPAGVQFGPYYPSTIELISDFFDARLIKRFRDSKAKVVTSIAMFYDLESPLAFMKGVESVLADEGIWHFEQSYMPQMLANNSYDTVCHEHLEYYALKQVKWMIDKTSLKIIDIEFNNVNGGSFGVTVASKASKYKACTEKTAAVLRKERHLELDTPKPFRSFRKNVMTQRDRLKQFLGSAQNEGKTVLGLGASTKGNVILQFCGVTPREIPLIGEVNSRKVGRYTPGTLIPICHQNDVIKMNPDYLLVLPWHFKEFFMQNRTRFGDIRFVFPLPTLSIE